MVHETSTPVDTLKARRTSASAFPIVCHAYVGSDGWTRLHFFPPLPARRRQRWELQATYCPTGSMHTRLARLGRVYNVTITPEQVLFPRRLREKDNQGNFEALPFLHAYTQHIAPAEVAAVVTGGAA